METINRNFNTTIDYISDKSNQNQDNSESCIIQQSINQMLRLEIESYYFYTDMEVYLYHLGLNGMSNWAKLQASEELDHFKKHVEYAKIKKISITLPGIDEFNQKFSSPLDSFEKALSQEIKLGDFYNSLDHKATNFKNPSFSNYLTIFVNEQDEEINLLDNIVKRVKLAGSNSGLVIIDHDLAQREV